MKELAENRGLPLGRTFRNRVTFNLADIREFAPWPCGYDLFATHFFLDFFDESELPHLVRRIASWTTTDVQGLFSNFREADGTFPASGLARRSVFSTPPCASQRDCK